MYKNEFNKLIFEELTISGDVQKEMIKVWDEIYQILPNIETSQYVNYDYTIQKDVYYEGVYFGNYSTKIRIFNEETRIFVNLFNFLTEKAFENNKNKINFLDASCVSVGKLKWLTIAIPMLSGRLIMIDAVKESLQHELEHIYQGNHDSKYMTIPDGKYANARELLRNPDQQISNLALIIYLSNLSEQDAYVNGLYAYLMSQDEPMVKIPWDVVKNSDAYIHLMSIKKIINELETSDEELTKKCGQYFNITPQDMLKKAKNVEFRFVRKIGKVLTKYHKDIRDKFNITEMFSPKIKTNPNYFI